MRESPDPRVPAIGTDGSLVSRRTVLRAGAIGGGLAIAGLPAHAARAAAAPGSAEGTSPTIVVGAQAPPLQQMAGRELQRYLWQLTGSVPQLLTDDAVVPTGSGPLIPLGTASSNRLIAALANAGQLPSPGGMPGAEGYVIKTVSYSGRPAIAVEGSDDHGVLYGGYRLLEQYGARFYIARDILPSRQAPFTVPQLNITEHPYVAHRGLLPWGDFLNGPSGYSLADWKRYIDQMAKMRMNTLIFHNYSGSASYVNQVEPFTSFSVNGITQTSGFLETSVNSQEWLLSPTTVGNMAFHSGDYLPYDVLGSDAARFTDGQPNAQINVFRKAEAMLQQIIHYASSRGVEVVFSTEFDILPQEFRSSVNPLDPAVLQARLDAILTTYPSLKHIQMNFSERNNVSTPDGIGAYLAMHDYLVRQWPGVQLLTGSWFQEERFTDMDPALPEDIIFSSLMPTDMSIKPQWAGLSSGRPAWPIPWLEHDGGLSQPQLKVARMQQQLPQMRSIANVTGVIAILWRERPAEPNIAYLAQDAWQPDGQALAANDFYSDYAAHTMDLGSGDAATAATIFAGVETAPTGSTAEYAVWGFNGQPNTAAIQEFAGLQTGFAGLSATSAQGQDSLNFWAQFMRWNGGFWIAQQPVPAAAAEAAPVLLNYFLVNCGSTQGEDDLQPDYGFYGSTNSSDYGRTITNDFGYPVAMQSVRFSYGIFGYRFTVPPQYTTYRVELYFAEIVATWGPGQRVFNIVINGTTVQQSFDPAGTAGGANIGVKLTFDVPVANQTLDISFIPVVAQPAVNVIRAYPIDASGNPLPKQFQPGNSLKAWADIKASGFRDAIGAYQQTVRDLPTLGGLVSAAGGRWYFNGTSNSYQAFESQIAAQLPVPPPDTVVARGTPSGAVITWRPYGGQAGSVTGYNVYRAPGGSQNFTKLNSTPVTGTSYSDTADGGYVYAVTALTATGTESPRSYEELVQAGSSDTQPPQVLLTPVPDHAVAHEPVTIIATVIGDRAPAYLTATLHYRRIGANQPWTTVPMAPNTAGRGNTFYADIPASAVNDDSLEYYVSASDGTNTGYAPPGASALTRTISIWPQAAAPPGHVSSVTAAPNRAGAGYMVSWPAASGPVHTYAIYRGTTAGFQPDATTYLTYVPSQQTSFADVTAPSGQRSYYKIVAKTIDERSAPASPPGVSP